MKENRHCVAFVEQVYWGNLILKKTPEGYNRNTLNDCFAGRMMEVQPQTQISELFGSQNFRRQLMNMEIQFLLKFGNVENHKVGIAMNGINQ